MYVKLFTSIYQGTLRGNSDGLLVFTNLLAHADRNGISDIHPRAIADETGISLERVRAALKMLESPDEESRTKDEEGRRIMLIDEHRDWGWLVVNYAKYREIRSEDDRRRQNREAQQRYRERHTSAKSADVSQDKPQSAYAEGDAEVEGKEEKRSRATSAARPDVVGEQIWKDWLAVRKAKKAGPVTQTVLQAMEREAEKAGVTLEGAVTMAAERGWQAFKAEWIKPLIAKQDVQHTTVPGPQGKDPALAKIEADEKRAVAMPEAVRAKLAELKFK